jgi:hypothetical protein
MGRMEMSKAYIVHYSGTKAFSKCYSSRRKAFETADRYAKWDKALSRYTVELCCVHNAGEGAKCMYAKRVEFKRELL